MVYHTRTFVLCITSCYFVLVFFSPFSIAITSLGEEKVNLSAFHTFIRFVLVWFCLFPLPLCVWERAAVCDCGTLWTFLLPFLSVSSSSLCLGRAAVCDCGTPRLFSYLSCVTQFTVSLAIQNEPSDDSDQPAQMRRLI